MQCGVIQIIIWIPALGIATKSAQTLTPLMNASQTACFESLRSGDMQHTRPPSAWSFFPCDYPPGFPFGSMPLMFNWMSIVVKSRLELPILRPRFSIPTLVVEFNCQCFQFRAKWCNSIAIVFNSQHSVVDSTGFSDSRDKFSIMLTIISTSGQWFQLPCNLFSMPSKRVHVACVCFQLQASHFNSRACVFNSRPLVSFRLFCFQFQFVVFNSILKSLVQC